MGNSKSLLKSLKISALTLLVFASNSFASNSLLQALQTASLKSKNTLTFDELKNRIEQHSYKKGYLSLGETHLEKESNLPLFMSLAEVYLGTPPPSAPSAACLEVNTHLHHQQERLNPLIQSLQVQYKNNPSFTDFESCNPNTLQQAPSRLIVDSGFFHQFNWIKNFGRFFDSTPVQAQVSQSIVGQLKTYLKQNDSSFFVTVLELPYLIYLENREALRRFSEGSSLLTLHTSLENSATAIRQRLQPLLKSTDLNSTKLGVVFLGSSFLKNIPSQSYFIITDLEYRLNNAPSYFLSELTKLNTSQLQTFQKLLQQNRWVYQETLMERDKKGDLGRTTLGQYPVELKGAASILWVDLPAISSKLLMVNSNDPKNTRLQCVVQNTSGTQKVSCGEYLDQLVY